jgi:hypothetical protein
MVLLLLARAAVLVRRLHSTLAVAILIVCALAVRPSAAAERTYVFTPADLVRMIDDFNADVLAQSASFGKAVKVRRGAVRLGNSTCASLAGATPRLLTRVRVVSAPANAALLAGKRANVVLPGALAGMGAASWAPPGAVALREPLWTASQLPGGTLELSTVGFTAGDPSGALSADDRERTNAIARLDLDLATPPGTGSTALILGATTELPPSRPGRRPKRAECVLLVHTLPVDVTALEELLAATPLTDTTRHRLTLWLDIARRRVDAKLRARAARSVKAFALEVANRLAMNEIAAADAEALITRSLATSEALEF